MPSDNKQSTQGKKTSPEPSNPTRPAWTSPGQWLLFISLLIGLVVSFLLWWMAESAPKSDNFKPEIVIIQMNDTYRLDALENGKVGGLSRVTTLVRQTLAQNKHVVLVHAGDFIAPSLESNVFRGEQMIDALNYLNRFAPLYVVPGNHEFDDPDSGMVVNAIERSNFEWLGSNVTVNPGNGSMRKKIVEHRIIPIGRLKLGVFALTLHGDHGGKDRTYAPVGFEEKYLINDASLDAMAGELPKDMLKKVTALKNRDFRTKTEIVAALSEATGIDKDNESLSTLADYASIGYNGIAERQIQALEAQGADLIIALTHLNMPDDRQLAQLRRAHPKFMWIAGGHEHYAQHRGISTDAALITKGDSNARSVWKVAVGFNNDVMELREERVQLKDPAFTPDQDYQRSIADNYRTALAEKFPYLDQEIGHTENIRLACLEGDEGTIRNVPSNWGTFIADQMRVTSGRGKLQIGLLNGGGLRIDDRPCGRLTFEHLERTFGFDSEIVYIKLKGQDLKERILEHSVAGKRGDGRFLQFAGITFRFDRHLISGHRISDIKVQNGSRWVNFNERATYSVAVPKYLYECNDDYSFREKVVAILPSGPDVRTVVYKALQEALRKKSGRKASSAPDVKAGAVELPRYVKASIPRLGNWVEIKTANPCPE